MVFHLIPILTGPHLNVHMLKSQFNPSSRDRISVLKGCFFETLRWRRALLLNPEADFNIAHLFDTCLPGHSRPLSVGDSQQRM